MYKKFRRYRFYLVLNTFLRNVPKRPCAGLTRRENGTLQVLTGYMDESRSEPARRIALLKRCAFTRNSRKYRRYYLETAHTRAPISNT